jgi:hypothetical protein
MDATDEQIYPLVKQWCMTGDPSKASEVLRQIALVTNCLPQMPKQLTEEQQRCVLRWLESNHPNAYLWAISQRCVGHPATVWGLDASQKVAFALRK